MIKRKDKRGLSTIVATLIILLLVLVAIGILWFVIRGIVQSGTEKISIDEFNVDLKIQEAAVIDLTDIFVIVNRNPGKGDLFGVLFICYNEDNSELSKHSISINELERKEFRVILSVIDTSNLLKISLYPIFLTSSGKEIIGNIQDEFFFGEKRLSQCGNGIREIGEQCDDGNLNSGDGCSLNCNVEDGWTCNVDTPNICTLSEPEDPSEPEDIYTWTGELMANGGFELGTLNGWVTPFGPEFALTTTSPQSGTYALYYRALSNINYNVRQDVSLWSYSSYIDSGNSVIDASGWGISLEPNSDLTRIQFIFLDSERNAISTALNTGYVSNNNWWKAEVNRLFIPANTRYLRVWINTYDPDGSSSGSLDSFSVRLGYL